VLKCVCVCCVGLCQDEILGDMVEAMDTDEDGVFDFAEFRTFLVQFLRFQM